MTTRTLVFLLGSLLGAVPAQTPPSITRGPYLQLGTPTSVIVRWRADPVGTGRVWWGTSPSALTNHVDALPGGALGIELAAQITGLQPATRYYYAVGLTNGTVLVGGDTDHSFLTAPAVGERNRFRAWVLGDSGRANHNARAVRDAYLDWSLGSEPDLWLMLGDNAYATGTDAEYQAAVFDMYPTTLRRSVLWPSFGNHDAYSAVAATQSGVYFELFDLPTAGEAGGLASGTEAYYAFDHGNVHFIVLDSEGSDRTATGPMATWLQADLQSTAQDWVVAYWHHPPYSKGTHNSDTEPRLVEMRQNILPILEAHGVDLVLCGHSHNYERSMLIDGHYGDSTTFDPSTMAVDTGNGSITGTGGYRKPTVGPAAHEGAVYVVNGASSSVGGFSGTHPVMVTSLAEMGSVVLDVNGLQIDLTYLDRFGTVRDGFTLVKGGVAPIRTRGAFLHGVAPWKFEDSGTDLGTAWRDPLYDDSSWASGNPILGFGEPWVTTPVSFGGNLNNVHPTTYFRQDFTVDVDPTSITRLRLSVVYDDAYVAYLNGQEVARRNLPGGPVSFAALASQPHEPAAYEALDVTAALPLLHQGSNLLAIEVHQAAPNSDDLVFDAHLSWEGADTPLDPVCATGVVGDILSVNGSSGGIGRSIEVRVGQAIFAAIDAPPTFGTMADFALFGRFGAPSVMTPFPVPSGGALCFTPIVVPDPSSFTLASSVNVPGAVFPSAPAPWSLTYPGGLPIPGLEIVVQPLVAPVGSALWRAGNAIRIVSVP